MEIERINEYTLKFFITYVDMEDWGFEREEIWYNRERGEELFWEMMDEAHHEEEFPLEGPMWIQIQALEEGLEIIVTRAQLSQDGSKLELPINDEKQIDLPMDANGENMKDDSYHVHKSSSRRKKIKGQKKDNEKKLVFLFGFDDFEDLLQLSHRFDSDEIATSLYYYDGRYFLYAAFSEEPKGDDTQENEDGQTDNSGKQDDVLSVLLEYGFESKLTIHRLREYGTCILQENVLTQLRHHFPPNP